MTDGDELRDDFEAVTDPLEADGFYAALDAIGRIRGRLEAAEAAIASLAESAELLGKQRNAALAEIDALYARLEVAERERDAYRVDVKSLIVRAESAEAKLADAEAVVEAARDVLRLDRNDWRQDRIRDDLAGRLAAHDAKRGEWRCTLPRGHAGAHLHDPSAKAGGECDAALAAYDAKRGGGA
jgi:chromosome segregation ATPase